ncbi:MAG: DMP19 family protein [Bacteroidaceae bacterium]|nr:DMP19 family protein [Bacteroidaceae bacterium]
MLPTISEKDILTAAAEGMDAFLNLFCDATLESIGGELNAQSMNQLNGEQITLLAYRMMREEVMDGGFIQLIHNGLGPFIFLNPFAKAMRLWGEELFGEPENILHEFSKLIYKGRKYFERDGDALTQPCTDEEFMALFEQYPQFDDLDDQFVETEEDITAAIARYIDAHLDSFAQILK